MKRASRLSIALLLCLGFSSDGEASGDDLTQAVGAVRSAVGAGDKGALAALAARSEPDPWLVVETLCAEAGPTLASRFAALVPAPSGDGLVAYVNDRWAPGVTAENMAALREAQADVQQFHYEDALEKTSKSLAGVAEAWRLLIHGMALVRLGRLAEGARSLDRGARTASQLQWWRGKAECLMEWNDALTERTADERESLAGQRKGDESALSLVQRAHIAMSQGHLKTATELFERCTSRSDLDPGTAAVAHLGLGHAFAQRGPPHRALAQYEASLERASALGSRRCVALATGGMGSVHGGRLGAHDVALDLVSRSIGMFEQLRYHRGVARALHNLASTKLALGQYVEALEHLERSEGLRQRTSGGELPLVFAIRGAVHNRRGEYAQALANFERAHGIWESRGKRRWAAMVREAIGIAHLQTGQYEQAFEVLNEVCTTWEELDHPAGMAQTKANIGVGLIEQGDYRQGLHYTQEAWALMKELDIHEANSWVRSNLGFTLARLGRVDEGIDHMRAALARGESQKHPKRVAEDSAYLARILREDANRPKEAQKSARRAVVLAKKLESIHLEILGLSELAAAYLADDQPGPALERALAALQPMNRLTGSLAYHQVSRARAMRAQVYDVGATAAHRLGDAASLALFLEAGRAGALLDALGSRQAIRDAALPRDLLALDSRTRFEETASSRAFLRAQGGGTREQILAAWQRLEASRARREEIVARIQREAKRAANVAYPKAATLDDIQDQLAPGDALVVYGLLREQALALVLTPTSHRTVDLGTTAGVAKTVAALSLSDRTTDPEAALARLRRTLIRPLGLSPETRRLLVSPAGALCYVPFSLLSGTRQVVYVPSGTTYRVLRADAAGRGRGVLAVGDPVYPAASGLSPVPATASEAKAVGSKLLLGPRATERHFAKALAERPRWRAVHLACHGRVDPVRPERSFLALTPTDENDGRVTVLEVFQMQFRADLVVLSACETGRGKVMKAEGLVGLAQAFLTAGTPRVLCSLWDVDDEATRALMIRFHELWKGAEGQKTPSAVAALEMAQAHVRNHPDHPEWQHPYYWAAWVLWGLP